MKKLFLISLLILPFVVNAQEGESENPKPYWKSASELIFSWGMVEDEPMDITSVVRFSMFFHFQEQVHFDMNEKFGVWTGFGIRNIGMINDLGDGLTLKQRSYSLGIPVAFKLGNFAKQKYISIGGEVEMMFHYKQKAFYDDSKFKKSEWFSDRTNLINPSVFLDINFSGGAYVRFKYYLMDFLVEDKQSITVDGIDVPYSPEKSQLFYFALGFTIDHKEVKKKTQKIDTAFSGY